MVRFGIGYDAHRLVEGRPLLLAGVHVPFDRGLEGHSDGDVACHAIADALLGAAALGDLGTHFKPAEVQGRHRQVRTDGERPPVNVDTLEVPKGTSSLLLLERTGAMVRQRGWQMENVDATIVAQHPRLAEHVLAMRQAVAQALGITDERVSIKATTTDGLGFTGTGEGIAAHAVASLTARTPEQTP